MDFGGARSLFVGEISIFYRFFVCMLFCMLSISHH